eukprot:2686795-Rhodomonas_salina.2
MTGLSNNVQLGTDDWVARFLHTESQNQTTEAEVGNAEEADDAVELCCYLPGPVGFRMDGTSEHTSIENISYPHTRHSQSRGKSEHTYLEPGTRVPRVSGDSVGKGMIMIRRRVT